MKIGLYAGSFNPFHKGHMNILEKAIKIFDEVIIAIGKNPEKSDDKFEISGLPVEFDTIYYDYLLTDLITNLEEERDCDVVLIRGLRDDMDLKYEAKQLQVMRDLKPDLKHILILCDREFNHISSSMIRYLMQFDEKAAKGYIV